MTEPKHDLSEILKASTFHVIDGTYIYAKATVVPTDGTHFMITVDEHETTVVTTDDQLLHVAVIERSKDDYALIALNVSIPFYSVGFLAAVSHAIAREGMDLLIVSTYSRDYVMVRHDQIRQAFAALERLGLGAQ